MKRRGNVLLVNSYIAANKNRITNLKYRMEFINLDHFAEIVAVFNAIFGELSIVLIAESRLWWL